MTFKESLRGAKRRSNPVKRFIRKIKIEIVYMICGLPRKTGVFLAKTLKLSLRGVKRRSNPVKTINIIFYDEILNIFYN